MRANYLTTINQFDRLAILSAEGPVTIAGLYEAHDQLRTLPEWRGDLDLLVVFQPDTTLDRVSFTDTARYADLFRRWNRQYRTGPHPRTAIVTDARIFNTACMIWATLRRDNWLVDVSFHSTEQDAMRWIHSSREHDARRSGEPIETEPAI